VEVGHSSDHVTCIPRQYYWAKDPRRVPQRERVGTNSHNLEFQAESALHLPLSSVEKPIITIIKIVSL